MVQTVHRDETPIFTTRSPIRIDGKKLVSGKGAPRLGQDTKLVTKLLEEDGE